MDKLTTASLSFLKSYDSLEKALIDMLGVSRSFIKKKSLNKKELKKKVTPKKEYQVEINIINRYLINPEYTYQYMDIIFENENFIIINKVGGIHSHPHSYLETNNCLSYLRHINKTESLNINKKSFDRGLLYRLDKVTSGVLILVKKMNVYEHLRNNYSDLIKKKNYLAIVEGKLEIEKKYTHYFKSSLKGGQKIIVSDMKVDGSKEGVCHIVPIKSNKEKNCTLVSVQLKTGLRHQIRSQLSHIGHPIIGDDLYGGRDEQRVYLHAYNYVIEDKTYNIKLDIKSADAPLFDSFFDLNTCL